MFFVSLGTKLIFNLEIFISVLPEAVVLFVALFFGQIASAGIVARFTGNFSWSDSLMIGFGMLGRPELACFLLNIKMLK